MSPTVFCWKGYRFYFFSREERRIHIHVYCSDDEAKFWLEPEVALAKNYRLSETQISELTEVITNRKDEIEAAWEKYFRS